MKFGLQRGAGLSRNDVPFSKVRGVSGMLQDGPARTPLGEVCPVRAGGADPHSAKAAGVCSGLRRHLS